MVSRAEQEPLIFALGTAIGLYVAQLLRTTPLLQEDDHSYSRGVRQTVWHMFRNQSGEMTSEAVSYLGWAGPCFVPAPAVPQGPPLLHSCPCR